MLVDTSWLEVKLFQKFLQHFVSRVENYKTLDDWVNTFSEFVAKHIGRKEVLPENSYDQSNLKVSKRHFFLLKDWEHRKDKLDWIN